jgi:hypothetical protein
MMVVMKGITRGKRMVEMTCRNEVSLGSKCTLLYVIGVVCGRSVMMCRESLEKVFPKEGWKTSVEFIWGVV